MDPTLWNLCQRDQLLALRDQARQQQAAGSAQAGHVVAWMEHILGSGACIASLTARRACLTPASATPTPLHSLHRAPGPMRTR